MTRSEHEPDPEVLEDLRLRDASERDPTRTRPTPALIGTWQPDPMAGMWACRGLNAANPCPQRTMVPVTAADIERLLIFNAELRRLGQDPIDSGTVVRCEPCRRGIAHQRSLKLWDRVDAVADHIRQLKASPDPRREREIIKQLEAWGHPDVAGLLQVLSDRAKGKSKGASREAL